MEDVPGHLEQQFAHGNEINTKLSKKKPAPRGVGFLAHYIYETFSVKKLAM
jgi:hypothetical protein